MPLWRPGFGPSHGRYWKTRFSTSSVSRTFFAFAYGPEVDDAAPVPLAREHHPRVLVLDGDRDVRERLVVAQPDVERRPVALDEVLLEVERLDLGAGDDHLEVGDRGRRAAPIPCRVSPERWKYAPNAWPQRLRLADVQHLSRAVAKEVDARLRRQALELVLDVARRTGYT